MIIGMICGVIALVLIGTRAYFVLSLATRVKARSWCLENAVRILAVVAAIIVVVFVWRHLSGFILDPTASIDDVASFAGQYWLVIAIIGGLAYAAAFAFVDEKTHKQVRAALLKSVLWTTIGLIIGTQGWVFVRDIFLPTPVCSNGSSLHVTQCRVSTAASTWTRAAEGTADDGMNLCFNPDNLVEVESRIFNGTRFYRFRSKSGETVVSYVFKMVPPGGSCSLF